MATAQWAPARRAAGRDATAAVNIEAFMRDLFLHDFVKQWLLFKSQSG